MKTLILWATWIAGIIAAILILFGVISAVFGWNILGADKSIVNYFHVANSFLLVAICCLLYGNCSEKQSK